MSYTVQQLADLAGISVRTLHHYDEIGLLKPSRIKLNGYRSYEETELLSLQQILFFKELKFPLSEIAKIIKDPNFKMETALKDQKKMLELKKKRLDNLTRTIDRTIKKINKQKNMEDKELYEGLSNEKMEEYAKEAKERWGNTEAYKESAKRVAKMSKDQMTKIQKDADALMKEIAENMDLPPGSEKTQSLIKKHYDGLKIFYEPSAQMYRGLGNMYVSDPRFTAYYDKYAIGLAKYMNDAMSIFSENLEKK